MLAEHITAGFLSLFHCLECWEIGKYLRIASHHPVHKRCAYTLLGGITKYLNTVELMQKHRVKKSTTSKLCSSVKLICLF